MIHPSPSIIARADTSIRDCVRKMKALDVGSILIVSDDEKMELIGIFTERDLLKRFELIESGEHWERPIRTIMSHPVKTLELEKIDEASSLMLKSGIRHLPIVVATPDSGLQLVGIISMRDIFASLVRERETSYSDSIQLPKVESSEKISEISLFSQDHSFKNLLRKVSHTSSLLHQLKLVNDAEKLLNAPNKNSLVIVDIDGMKNKEWAELLHQINQNSKIHSVMILFDPMKQTQSHRKILEKLSESPKFFTFAKPVNIFNFLTRLSSLSK